MSRSKKDARRMRAASTCGYWYPVAQWERVHGRLAGVTHDVAESGA